LFRRFAKRLSGNTILSNEKAAQIIECVAKYRKAIERAFERLEEMKRKVNEWFGEKVEEILGGKHNFEKQGDSLKNAEKEGTNVRKQEETPPPEGGLTVGKAGVKEAKRKVLALGLRDDKAGLNYSKWAKDNDWHTYGELSGRGSFSEQIKEAMDNADDIHLNLDGPEMHPDGTRKMLNVKNANGKLNDFGEPAAGYTNYELWLLKTEPKYADKVVWYKNGERMPKGYNPFTE